MSIDRIFKPYRKEHEVTKSVKITIDEATITALFAIQDDFKVKFGKLPSLSHILQSVLTTFLSELQPDEIQDLYHEITTRPMTRATFNEIATPLRDAMQKYQQSPPGQVPTEQK